ncbi:MAG TPA: ATP-dependent DNA helicase RecG [Firmicutes bacterium]|jgi:ATP-dependent DNA helicase RecG|nr:MAG: hypothetical protein AA931_03545 [Peptococcaceae bacterium 1109]HHT74370.1 ATP-dependent DNA helicase RecG [Bacillota bacterium]
MGTSKWLDKEVTVLPGVGANRRQLLAKLGLYTLRDVLYGFPRTYQDFTRVWSPDELREEGEYLVTGELVELTERPISGGRRLVQASLHMDGSYLRLTWFLVHRGRGYTYIYNRLKGAKRLWAYGHAKRALVEWEMNSPEFFLRQPKLGLTPVYPLVAGITNKMRISWAQFALEHLDELYECLPSHLTAKYGDRHTAIRDMHFPGSWAAQKKARTRLVFEEFFLFHLGLQSGVAQADGWPHKVDGPLVKRFLEGLPFRLTVGQAQSIADVRADMESTARMGRLIQGEVGSGKTVVAQYAAVKAVESGGQVAIMVPTEVLARQMADRFRDAFQHLGIEVDLLVGSLTKKNREEVLKRLQNGELQVVVGTHALITEGVEFKKLTLAIVDEQHRFGVEQRQALGASSGADMLVMSATPIPRSLALTMYGDLDVSTIRELPRGRKPVDTRLIHPSQRERVYTFVTSRVKQGEQAFVVFPLVEESDKLDLKAAVQEMERLKAGPLRGVRVGLVHGQMGKEKDEILQAFYRHELDVLVATTVIEVGMNIPRATVMVIENADRFGLAQLHQLRGRVGRGDKQGYCFLIADLKTDTVRARLNAIRNSNDGFLIAEEDLKLRGPGDLLGLRQSGQPMFLLGDIVADQELLIIAAEAAKALLGQDPELDEYPTLKEELNRQRPAV